MQKLFIILFILLTGISAYADDIFIDKELRELRLTEVNIEEGNAWIQDADGNEAEISTGDVVGIERGVVTEIDGASITIQTDNTRTKMPVVYGFE